MRLVCLGVFAAALGLSSLALGATPSSVEVRLPAPPSVQLRPFQLRSGLESRLGLLRSFSQPEVETPSEAWRFLRGPWGFSRWTEGYVSSYELRPFAESWTGSSMQVPSGLGSVLAQWGIPGALTAQPAGWGATGDEAEFPQSPEPLTLFSLPEAVVPLHSFVLPLQVPSKNLRACSRRPVQFVRFGAESDTFMLLDCDGSIAPEAIDRLSVLARPPGVSRPEVPLPESPDEAAALRGEWLPSIKLVHPRLVWLMQKIAEAFPSRPIYITSGYRTGKHEGRHGQARALDMSVMGIDSVRLYKLCRTLPDAGCGYYPNHDFVHVDVRPTGTGHAFWIDVSEPGQPSEYVDSWPGVEEQGALVWKKDSEPGE